MHEILKNNIKYSQYFQNTDDDVFFRQIIFQTNNFTNMF